MTLGVGAYKHHDAAERIQRIQDARKKEDFKFSDIIGFLDEIIELTHLALLRNYPEIPLQEIEEGISDIVTAMLLVQYLISQDEITQVQRIEHAKNIQPPTMTKN